MRQILIRVIQNNHLPDEDRAALYRLLEVIGLLEEGRYPEAALRVLARSEALPKLDKAIARLRQAGYEVAIRPERDGYLAMALTPEEEVAWHVVAHTPEEAVEWLAASLVGTPAFSPFAWRER